MGISSVFILAVALLCVREAQGYGEPAANGRPIYSERANFNLINAVRVSPSGYKSVYMSGYTPSVSGILVSYAAVSPIYMEPRLFASAYNHSLDMATKNWFAHNSSDGTTGPFTRIGYFYSCSGYEGENIAAGNADPLATSNQWLCDETSSNVCANDKDPNDADGHRANILSPNYGSAGVGFAANSAATYVNYWTQDFGGSCTGQTSAIYSGSHLISGSNIKFAAVYHSSTAPSSANVVIAGTSYALTVELGSTTSGSYAYTTTKGSSGCRSYYFTFVVGSTTYRYPDTGCLTTTNENSACTASFDAACTGSSGSSSSTTGTAPTAAPTVAPTAAPTVKPSTTGSSSTTGTAPTVAPTTKPATSAPTVAPTTKPATSAPTSPPTSGAQYIYQNGALVNGWSTYGNPGVTVNNAASYSGQTSVSAVLPATTTYTKFFEFKHAALTNTWKTISFYGAASTATTATVFFNNGYTQSAALTTSWQLFTFTPSYGLGTTSTDYSTLIFQTSGSSQVTFYIYNLQVA